MAWSDGFFHRLLTPFESSKEGIYRSPKKSSKPMQAPTIRLMPRPHSHDWRGQPLRSQSCEISSTGWRKEVTQIFRRFVRYFKDVEAWIKNWSYGGLQYLENGRKSFILTTMNRQKIIRDQRARTPGSAARPPIQICQRQECSTSIVCIVLPSRA